jgi:IS30 family transposase
MKLYTQLILKEAKEIIILKNKGMTNYKIAKTTGVSKGKIKRCLDKSKRINKRPNIQRP